MYVSIRRYSTDSDDATEIVDLVRQGDIADIISALPGFVSYYLLDCGEGTVASVSVFEDKAGAVQSNAIAARWVREKILPSHYLSPPEITGGNVVVSA